MHYKDRMVSSQVPHHKMDSWSMKVIGSKSISLNFVTLNDLEPGGKAMQLP